MPSRFAKVDFIGLGAQKCGTTWIYRNLEAHPSVSVARGEDKDTRFFTCYYDRGYQWYEAQFGAAESNSVIGEVSTSYFYDGDAPERIRAYSSSVKLFVCLRNPIERIVSNHRHEARRGHIWGKNLSLSAALDNNPAYLFQTRYALHLRRWHKYFEPAQLKVLFFDDLRANPERFMSDVYRFLGVDPSFVADDIGQKANVSRIPRNRYIERSIVQSGRLLRTMGLGRIVEFGRKIGLNERLRNLNTVRDEAEMVDISDKALRRIRDELYQDVTALSDMTGRDLGNWL